MATEKVSTVSIPFSSQWRIHASIAGRPIVWGILTIQNVSGNRLEGTVNFRGRHIPIRGFWDETTKQISFDSPYASYAGNLSIYDDPGIQTRHFLLNGRILMKPPSSQAGEFGTWVATTNTVLTGQPIVSDTLPPVGAFMLQNLFGRFR